MFMKSDKSKKNSIIDSEISEQIIIKNDEVKSFIKYLVSTMIKINATELHFPYESTQRSNFRIQGILVDIDDSMEINLLKHKEEIQSLFIGDNSSMNSIVNKTFSDKEYLPDNLDGLNLLLIPTGSSGRNNIIMKPNLVNFIPGEIHSSWEKSLNNILETSSRPLSGPIVFLSPERDVSGFMMRQAISKVSLESNKKVLVIDTIPWKEFSDGTFYCDPELNFNNIPASYLFGIDIVVFGESYYYNDKVVKDLIYRGIQVWVSLISSVFFCKEKISSMLSLSHHESLYIVESARLFLNDSNSTSLTDTFAKDWLKMRGNQSSNGALQLSSNSGFPQTILISSENRPNFGYEIESFGLEISKIGASLVDSGIVCGVDASRKLS